MNKLLPERKDFLTLPKGVEVTKTGLKIAAPLSYAAWEALGASLQHFHKSILFWIGDWLVYGEQAFNQEYSQAIEARGYKTRLY